MVSSNSFKVYLQVLVVNMALNQTWITLLQGRRRRSGWSGLSRTNNLELNQLADQLELYITLMQSLNDHIYM